jgi:hypothetical protein
MRTLNLPTYSFKLKYSDDSEQIYDQFRRKFVRLTPEEWVRQNLAQYLINEKAYPTGRMVIEKSLQFNNMKKRCDILVYDQETSPLVMIECKAPQVVIKKEVFDQIAVYNLVFKVRFLIVSNGMEHFMCRIDFDNKKTEFLSNFPSYNELLFM